MKKNILYLSFSLIITAILILLIFLALSENPQKNLKIAFNNIVACNNLTLNIKANINDGTGSSIVEAKELLDITNKTSYYKSKYQKLNTEIIREKYTDFKKEFITYSKLYVTTSNTNIEKEWIKINEKNYGNIILNSNISSRLINESKKVKKISSDISGLKKYELTISSSILKDIYKDYEPLFLKPLKAVTQINEINENTDITIYVYINTKTKTISKIIANLDNFIKTLSETSKEFKLSINIDDINSTNSVLIPDETKTKAIKSVSDHYYKILVNVGGK